MITTSKNIIPVTSSPFLEARNNLKKIALANAKEEEHAKQQEPIKQQEKLVKQKELIKHQEEEKDIEILNQELVQQQQQVPEVHKERTLALIPCTDNLTEIIDYIKQNDFNIVQSKTIQYSLEQAQSFYQDHITQNYYDKMVRWLSNGSNVCALILEKQNAVEDWRLLMGPTTFKKARKTRPNSIRALFLKNDTLQNATHGSDSDLASKKEIDFIFGHASFDSLLERGAAAAANLPHATYDDMDSSTTDRDIISNDEAKDLVTIDLNQDTITIVENSSKQTDITPETPKTITTTTTTAAILDAKDSMDDAEINSVTLMTTEETLDETTDGKQQDVVQTTANDSSAPTTTEIIDLKSTAIVDNDLTNKQNITTTTVAATDNTINTAPINLANEQDNSSLPTEKNLKYPIAEPEEIVSTLITEKDDVTPTTVTELKDTAPNVDTETNKVASTAKEIEPTAILETKEIESTATAETKEIAPTVDTEAKEIEPTAITETKEIAPTVDTEAKEIEPTKASETKEIIPTITDSITKEITSTVETDTEEVAPTAITESTVDTETKKTVGSTITQNQPNIISQEPEPLNEPTSQSDNPTSSTEPKHTPKETTDNTISTNTSRDCITLTPTASTKDNETSVPTKPEEEKEVAAVEEPEESSIQPQEFSKANTELSSSDTTDITPMTPPAELNDIANSTSNTSTKKASVASEKKIVTRSPQAVKSNTVIPSSSRIRPPGIKRAQNGTMVRSGGDLPIGRITNNKIQTANGSAGTTRIARLSPSATIKTEPLPPPASSPTVTEKKKVLKKSSTTNGTKVSRNLPRVATMATQKPPIKEETVVPEKKTKKRTSSTKSFITRLTAPTVASQNKKADSESIPPITRRATLPINTTKRTGITPNSTASKEISTTRNKQ